MDDDDLIMNFAVPLVDAPVQVQKSVKVSGGRWKERRDMRFKLEGRERRPVSGVNNIEVEGLRKKAEQMLADMHPGKKRDVNSINPERRQAHEKRDRADGPVGIPSKKIKFAESNGEHGGKNNSYVSSLFTSNKVSDLSVTTDETAHLPSNAPLKDASTFSGLGLDERLATHLTTSMRYLAPTKVQGAVAPVMMETQKDYFVKAQTGSGKTLAFVLPIVHRLMQNESITRLSGLFAVILTPTRELASQIYSVLELLLRCHHHIVPGIVVGGEKKKSEKARIRKGVNILVGTPGRLADHLENTESLDVLQVRWLVLDEGDRLVELGFHDTIAKISDHLTTHSKLSPKWKGLPTRRTNILCSATMPEDVKKLGNTLLTDPEMISVDKETSNNATAPDQLVQKVMVVPPKLRLVTLAGTLKAIKPVQTTRTIVFFSCSDSVDFHFDVFRRGGRILKPKKSEKEMQREEKEREERKEALEEVPTFKSRHDKYKNKGRNDQEKPVSSNEVVPKDEACCLMAPQISLDTIVFRLHGSLSQNLRSATLHQFATDTEANKGKHLVLFCTDVASRGLDMPNIAHVVEYDPPFSVDDHLHRIGRSARVGKEGEATLFLLPGEEEGYVDGMLRVVHPKSIRIVNYESLLKTSFGEEIKRDAPKGGKPDPKAKAGKWDVHATTWHLEVERWLLEDSGALDRALHAFTSHIRAYATHLSAERKYFNVKLLHLGHLAKSFGLRETPKKLGRSSALESSKKKEDPRKMMLRIARQTEKARSSEFNY